ncbi:MAG TPA: WecB/TagA/CpsF family glycosyltransferase [Rhizobiaceae bacterium]|nr:WecB/TagA/CpsF family glycosyltransferase [Rhizobiaceae bacterium]
MNVHPVIRREYSIDMVPTREILGVDVAPLSTPMACAELEARIDQKRFTRIAFLNAHVSNLAAMKPAFRETLRDFMVFADGVGVDIASRMLHGETFPDNLNGTDFVPSLLAFLKRPVKVALLGSRRESVEGAAERFAEIAPFHRYIVVSDGYFDAAKEQAILETLEAERPDILLIAMGVPKQEEWIARNLSGRHCTLAFGVGALFDLTTGVIPRAPLWVRRARSEWVWRLMREPRRLFRRYVIGNPMFLARLGVALLFGARSKRVSAGA